MTHNLPEKDDAPWLDTTYDGFNMTQEPYPDEMFEEAERREAANKVMTVKVSDEDLEKVLDAAAQRELEKYQGFDYSI